MVQFWAQKEVNFVYYCVVYFAYCAVVMTEYFDVMEVCCEAVVTCVESEMCHCLFSGFIFVVFPWLTTSSNKLRGHHSVRLPAREPSTYGTSITYQYSVPIAN
jgi:hypothetical protein